MASSDLVSFEAAFDEFAATPDKRLFKDAVISDMATKGILTIESPDDGNGGDILLKTMDAHVSRGYNVFNSIDDYSEWMRQSMHDPTDEEVDASLREQNGTGA